MTTNSVAWPGLSAPRLRFDVRLSEGAAVNVGRLDCSLHTGTHADAPFHVDGGGPTVEQLPPDLFVGPCRVVRLDGDAPVGRAALEGAGVASSAPARLLIATGQPFDGRHFPSSVPHLTAEAAEWLVGLGVRLVGVDVPSIDPLDSKTMDAHHLIFAAGGGVLENLDLGSVAAGAYELYAPPLKLVGADASPVRALLRPAAPR